MIVLLFLSIKDLNYSNYFFSFSNITVGAQYAACTTDADCLSLTSTSSYFHCDTLASPTYCKCNTGFTWNLLSTGSGTTINYSASNCSCTGSRTIYGSGTTAVCGKNHSFYKIKLKLMRFFS